MNTNVLILLFAMGLLPAGSFLYGRLAMRDKSALYLRMIVDGVGCLAISRIFFFVKTLTEDAYPTGFHIGILGITGVFAFFFTANFGQIDSLCDDGSAQYKKYRLLPLAVPGVMAVLYFIMFFVVGSAQERVVLAVLFIGAALAGYYHCKLLIFPDVDFGVVRCLRPYNLLALLYSAAVIAENCFLALGLDMPMLLSAVTATLISCAIVPAVVKGVEKWTA